MGKRAGGAVAGKAKAKAIKVLPPAPLTSNDCINAEIQSHLAQCDAKIKDKFNDLVSGNPTDACGLAVDNEREAAKNATKLQALRLRLSLVLVESVFRISTERPKICQAHQQSPGSFL